MLEYQKTLNKIEKLVDLKEQILVLEKNRQQPIGFIKE